jgi:hypothetical protein
MSFLITLIPPVTPIVHDVSTERGRHDFFDDVIKLGDTSLALASEMKRHQDPDQEESVAVPTYSLVGSTGKVYVYREIGHDAAQDAQFFVAVDKLTAGFGPYLEAKAKRDAIQSQKEAEREAEKQKKKDDKDAEKAKKKAEADEAARVAALAAQAKQG